MNIFIKSCCIIISAYLVSCIEPKTYNSTSSDKQIELQPTYSIIEDGTTLRTRFAPPNGFERNFLDTMSFGFFLSNLPLKSAGEQVTYYDGRLKSNSVHAAVIDLPIGNKNLHQCADAVMRLRADYLRSIGLADRISFSFTNGMKVPYRKWMEGQRILVKGNRTEWIKSAAPSDSDKSYWSYLETIFMYAGTLSLSKEMNVKTISDMSIGDVLIKGGSPGHAVIVVDMTQDENGEKLFMIAQSYMPAQEIHILKNLNASTISPWYKLEDFVDKLETPEWIFNSTELKTF
jgi:hypothetical protein